MDSFNVVKVDDDGIDFDVIFSNPITVSTEDEPNLLVVLLDLSDFEDSDGKKLPASVLKIVNILTQMTD